MDYKRFKKKNSNLKLANFNSKLSHLKLTPSFRQDIINSSSNINNSKRAGVVALLYTNNEGFIQLVLILRNTYKGVHSDQFGFPGGKYEESDRNTVNAAIRECYEEIGVKLEDYNLVRKLSQLYIPPSNFTVFPFLFFLDYTPTFFINKREVKKIISIDLQELINSKIENLIIQTPNFLSKDKYADFKEVPCFNLNGCKVWGATGMILSEIKDLFNNVY
jgi:8-oxo-dGTP pyrophosphatase MutT (NUDIX family)